MNNSVKAALMIMGFSFLAIILGLISFATRGDTITVSHLYCMSILAGGYLAGHAGFLYHTRNNA